MGDPETKEMQERSDKAYKYVWNFCIDYCKDKKDRAEFFKQLSEYLDAEIELERWCNQ